MNDNRPSTADQRSRSTNADEADGHSHQMGRRQFLGAVTGGAMVGVGLSSPATGHEPPTVAVGNTYYDPIGLYVDPGTTVRFEVVAGTHTVTAYEDRIPAGASPFDSETLSGGTFEHTFEEPGTYDYFCRPHAATQVGRIVVGEPGGPAAQSPIPDAAVPDSDRIVEAGSIGIDSFDDAASDTCGHGHHDCSPSGMMDGLGRDWWWLVPTGLFAAVLGAIGVAVAVASHTQSEAQGDDEAMEILQDRFRRGEIDAEEFERRRERIRRLRQDPPR